MDGWKGNSLVSGEARRGSEEGKREGGRARWLAGWLAATTAPFTSGHTHSVCLSDCLSVAPELCVDEYTKVRMQRTDSDSVPGPFHSIPFS